MALREIGPDPARPRRTYFGRRGPWGAHFARPGRSRRGEVFVVNCDSAARGGRPFPLGRREDVQKETYWGHIDAVEMSPGDISLHITIIVIVIVDIIIINTLD